MSPGPFTQGSRIKPKPRSDSSPFLRFRFSIITPLFHYHHIHDGDMFFTMDPFRQGFGRIPKPKQRYSHYFLRLNFFSPIFNIRTPGLSQNSGFWESDFKF
jgi:hypothetical protein